MAPTPPHQSDLLDPIPLDFRAPPPSPITAPRSSSSIANDQVLVDFLENTLRVPNLVLPDHIFPKLSTLSSEQEEIPTVDFQSLSRSTAVTSLPAEKGNDINPCTGRATRDIIMESLERVGCFQLRNHGIDAEVVQLAVARAAEVFLLPAEQKARAVRSPDIACGFEEVCGGAKDEEVDTYEELVWCNRDDELRLKMEGIWPVGYAKFRGEMESLTSAMENISKAILLALRQDVPPGTSADHKYDDHNKSNDAINYELLCRNGSSICYIYKHPNHSISVDQSISALRHDVVRMMVRGSDYPHALSLHVCGGKCKEFHIYSKKGWVSFVPNEDALIVTSGDQTQAWTGKQCKHVVGRSIYTGKEGDDEFISMAFLYGAPCINSTSGMASNSNSTSEGEDQKIISLQQQVLFAIFLTISCQFSLYIYRIFYKFLSGW